MVPRPRAAAPSVASLNRRMTVDTVLVAAIALFAVTSLILHEIISNADDYDDDASAGGGSSGGGFFFERRQGRRRGTDDPLKSGSATKRSRDAKRKNRLPKKRMDGDVNLDDTYVGIRAEHDRRFPPGDVERLKAFASSLRTHDYQLVEKLPYDVINCPPTPPDNYPKSWLVLDVLDNWNPNDTADPHSHFVHQGICRFDATTEYEKALAYREAEVPFVIRDDPVVLPTVERWNQPEYLPSILGHTRTYRTDMANTNQLMFYRTNPNGRKPKDWEEPTKEVQMTYSEWLEKANNPDPHALDPDQTHWYFRLNGKSMVYDKYLFEELPFFKPEKNFYMVDPNDARGINCRFGMRGNTAENHFDASRNFIALFGGERRYLLSDPNQCRNLALYPMGHPSARHSEVDWSNPDLNKFPQFRNAKVHEVVLQAGDVLYLPTHYFHHIISLDTNFQCNARSGITQHYMKSIRDCGFRAV